MEFEEINKKYNTEFTNKLYENRNIFYEIYGACGNKFINGWGSYLFDGRQYKYYEGFYNKQELLYNLAKESKKVLEIGTYMGHSALIMLLANPDLKITCIDISDEYALPSINVLNKYFNNAITFIKEDGAKALENLNEKYDLFHIDGDHSDSVVEKEVNNILKYNLNSREDNILRLLFDDVGCIPNVYINIMIKFNIFKKIIPKVEVMHWSNCYFEITL